STMLNLMKGLHGYTFCSGIICGSLNGSDYTAVPLADDDSIMEIGYITKKNIILSEMGEVYINELEKYLDLKK
ncbi:MAG: LysR family transcriptional regulator, partial [Ruminococcus sp.]|nr:LysR family transcriptional regulator [Ruminococcus sp.]